MSGAPGSGEHSPRARPPASRGGSVIVCALSLVLSLGAGETILRLAGAFEPPPVGRSRPRLYERDPNIGYRLERSTAGWHRLRSTGDSTRVRSNRAGFRADRELGEEDGRPRVLVVGDSFVFGAGVEPEDRLTERLEALEPDWRVDNLGMSGWGLDLMIRGLEHVGLATRPAVVVLCLYTDDFLRLHPYYLGMGYDYDKFTLRDGELATEPYPEPTGPRKLRLYQAAYRLYWQLDRNRFDLHEALLDRFLALSREHGFRPVIVFIPKRAVTPEHRERVRFLEEWSGAHGVELLDLTAALHAEPPDETYIEGDTHWTPSGHAITARELADLLGAPSRATAGTAAR